MRAFLPYFETARRVVQASGPYLLLELLLPGGTLFAVLLFLYRRKGSRLAAFVDRVARFGNDRLLSTLTSTIMLPLDVYAWVRRIERRPAARYDGLEALDLAPAYVRPCARLLGRSEVIAVH